MGLSPSVVVAHYTLREVPCQIKSGYLPKSSTIISYTLRTPANGWADIRQFRNGSSFRQTRFYQFNSAENRWLRSEPDPLFWSRAQEQLETQHFTLNYAVEDHSLMASFTQRLEQDHLALCEVLGCTKTSDTPKIKVTLRGTQDPMNSNFETLELQLPSPRVSGFFEDNSPAERNYMGLYPLASILINKETKAGSEAISANHLMFNAIGTWAVNHVAPQIDFLAMFPIFWEHRSLLPIEQLRGTFDKTAYEQVYFEAMLMTYFIEQEYGAASVAHLLHALSSATSMQEAIETGLGVPFAEFDQKWQAWTKANFAAP